MGPAPGAIRRGVHLYHLTNLDRRVLCCWHAVGDRNQTADDVEDIMGEQATVKLWAAAGKTLEELTAIGSATHRFRFIVASEEDPTGPRPLVRQLQFPNLAQAVEFAKLFDGGAQADVWIAEPGSSVQLWDHPVTLSVVFRLEERPAIVHGEDDMRDVARAIRSRR